MNSPEPTIILANKITAKNSTLLIPTFADTPLTGIKNFVDADTLRLIEADYQNRAGETKLVYASRRVILFGLGKKAQLNLGAWRRAVQTAVLTARTTGSEVLELIVPNFSKPEFLEMAAFAAQFACYDFLIYKHDQKPKHLKKIIIVGKSTTTSRAAVNRGLALAYAANTARDLANHPANVATPTHLANHAKQMGRQFGFKVKVLNREQIKKIKLIFGKFIMPVTFAPHF